MSFSTTVVGGHFPVGVRQSIKAGKQFTGVAPELTGPPLYLFTAESYADNVTTYVKPDVTPLVFAADKAGLFTFGETAVEIGEILCDAGALNQLKVAVADADGSHEVLIHDFVNAVTARLTYSPPILVLPNHQLKLYTQNNAGAKTVTVYVVRAGKRV